MYKNEREAYILLLMYHCKKSSAAFWKAQFFHIIFPLLQVTYAGTLCDSFCLIFLVSFNNGRWEKIAPHWQKPVKNQIYDK